MTSNPNEYVRGIDNRFFAICETVRRPSPKTANGSTKTANYEFWTISILRFRIFFVDLSNDKAVFERGCVYFYDVAFEKWVSSKATPLRVVVLKCLYNNKWHRKTTTAAYCYLAVYFSSFSLKSVNLTGIVDKTGVQNRFQLLKMRVRIEYVLFILNG